jgi:hypothetical protein
MKRGGDVNFCLKTSELIVVGPNLKTGNYFFNSTNQT